MSDMKMAKGQGKMETNQNGVKRESNKNRGRWDLFPVEGMEELAIWYELGAEKYGDRNWEKGIDVQDCANRMVRHSMKAANGWMDEGPFAHFAAVAWNAIACMTAIKRNPYDNNLFREVYLKELGLSPAPEQCYNTTEDIEDIIRDINELYGTPVLNPVNSLADANGGSGQDLTRKMNKKTKYRLLLKAIRSTFTSISSNVCRICMYYNSPTSKTPGCSRLNKECIFEPDETKLLEYED